MQKTFASITFPLTMVFLLLGYAVLGLFLNSGCSGGGLDIPNVQAPDMEGNFVLSDGSPASEAMVTLKPLNYHLSKSGNANYSEITINADKDGRFQINDIEKGIYTIHVTSKNQNQQLFFSPVKITGETTLKWKDKKLSIATTIKGQLDVPKGLAKNTFQVDILGLELKTSTDSNGFFKFQNVPLGRYIVYISAGKIGNFSVIEAMNHPAKALNLSLVKIKFPPLSQEKLPDFIPMKTYTFQTYFSSEDLSRPRDFDNPYLQIDGTLNFNHEKSSVPEFQIAKFLFGKDTSFFQSYSGDTIPSKDPINVSTDTETTFLVLVNPKGEEEGVIPVQNLGLKLEGESETQPKPGDSLACPQDVDPVCGTDGKTYSNKCSAQEAEVEIKHKGKCGEEPPEECFEIWEPVCGNDNITYTNQCYAKKAGVQIMHEGSCR